MKKVAIITPTYNRAYCLGRVYKSLERQKNKDFVWIVVDDGSNDRTTDLVVQFKETASFEIQYLRQPNGGKHRALNRGIANAQSELIVLLDSDDFLLDDAIEKILDYHEKVENPKRICGYSFLKLNQDKEIIGKKFPKDYFIDNHIDCRFNQNISGDKAEVFLTKVLKKYPFPEIEGEKFITEAIVWSKIGRDYDTIYINDPIMICEYLPDGLSSKYDKLCMKNPKGMALFCNENSDNAYKKEIRDRYKRDYVAYSLLAGKKIKDIKNEALNDLPDEAIEDGKKLYNKYKEILRNGN